MGTRSDIIVQRADGKWARVYCHWDGYLEHNGRILFDHYTSQRQAEELVALGDLSALGEMIGEKHPFDAPQMTTGNGNVSNGYKDYRAKYGSWCLAYHRDRGESWDEVQPRIGDSLQAVWPEEDSWTEFAYVWQNGKWWVGDPDEGSQCLVDLGEALLGNQPVTPAVKAFGAVIGQHHASSPAKDHGWN